MKNIYAILCIICLIVELSNALSLMRMKKLRLNATHNCKSSLHMKSDWSPSATLPSKTRKTFYPLALYNYVAATSLEWGLITSVLAFADRVVKPLHAYTIIPYFSTFTDVVSNNAANISNTSIFLLMMFLSLRSRVFSPLDNSRPTASKDDPIFKKRRRPWWQPPAIAFPIIWSTITVLRSISAVLVYQATGVLLSKPLLAFVAHLSIGDTWNTINNVENRIGTAVPGVALVWLSAAYTCFLYYQSRPAAAKVFAPSVVWLSIATLLVTTIYRMNFLLFDNPSMFPSKEEGAVKPWKLPIFGQMK